MPQFASCSLETARSEAWDTLQQTEHACGFVPNLPGTMIESPQTAKAYPAQGRLLGDASFDVTEQQVVSLTASRDDRRIPDDRLETLRVCVALTVNQNGRPSDGQLDADLASGFTRQQAFEVILGMSMKTIPNYINHIADIPLDRPFTGQHWHVPASAVA